MATSPCQVVADFFDASLDPTRWPQALLSLGECMKADAVGLLLHDFDDGSGKYERAVGITADAQANYRRTYARSNPWLQSDMPFRGPSAVVRGSEIVGTDVLKASAFHRNWLRPTGLYHHLFALVDRRGSVAAFLVLARRAGRATLPRKDSANCSFCYRPWRARWAPVPASASCGRWSGRCCG